MKAVLIILSLAYQPDGSQRMKEIRILFPTMAACMEVRNDMFNLRFEPSLINGRCEWL